MYVLLVQFFKNYWNRSCNADIYCTFKKKVEIRQGKGSALHADDLAKDSFHGNQVFLIFHDHINVFISPGDFVDDAAIFPAFDAFGLLFEIIGGEDAFGFGAAHSAAGAV